MTDEQKAWEVTVHRANQGNEFFSIYDANAILAADEELKRLREEVERLKAERYTAYSTLVDRVSTIEAENARLREVVGAAGELLEVSDLRGDIDDIPGPCDDPKLWTARLIMAWEEIRAALDALKKIQS